MVAAVVAPRLLRLLGISLAPEHVVGVAETVHLHVGLAPNPLTVHVRRERQVDVVPLKIEEATQRGPDGEAAAQDVVKDRALMASPGVETERGVVAEIGACLAGLRVGRFRGFRTGSGCAWGSRAPTKPAGVYTITLGSRMTSVKISPVSARFCPSTS